MMAEELAETDRIEADLARTRARMDSRLDELQDHLAPKQMINDAFAYFRGGEGAEFTSDLVAKAKANPIPVALTGIGIAWLMASSGSPAHNESAIPSDELETRLRRAEALPGSSPNEDEETYIDRLHAARGKATGVIRSASDTTTSYAGRVSDAFAAARDGARRTSHDLRNNADGTLGIVRDGARAGGASLQEGTNNMARSTRDTLSSLAGNPFALGAIAVVIGAVAGSLLPTLEQEEDALGSTATKLRTAGKGLAQDVVDRGGRIASETLDAVKESASSHGLTPNRPIGDVLSDIKSGGLASQVKEVAHETLQAGQESAQKHFSSDHGSTSGSSDEG